MAEDDATWTTFADQIGPPLPNGWLPTEVSYQIFAGKYEAGRTYRMDFNTGVFGPVIKDRDGKAQLTTPAAGKSVSLRAEVVDKQDNKSTIAVYDAFRGR